MEEKPYTDQIIDNAGLSFSFGVMFGTVIHFIDGIYRSPKGTRFIGGTQAVVMNAPRLGGSCAQFSTTYFVLGDTIAYTRQKEDPLNPIIAGFLTGGLFEMHQGLRPAIRRSLRFSALVALLEGVGFMLRMYPREVLYEEAPRQHDPKPEPAPAPPSPLWYGRLFQGK